MIKNFANHNLIAVEGIDGTGKTTVTQKLAVRINEMGNNEPLKEEDKKLLSQELQFFSNLMICAYCLILFALGVPYVLKICL